MRSSPTSKPERAPWARVEVSHLAATPVGRRVTAFAEVTATTGSHIEFRVWAMDQAEEIGDGTHARVVIQLDKFSRRLAAKFANKGEIGT